MRNKFLTTLKLVAGLLALFSVSAQARLDAIEFVNPGGLVQLQHLCGVAFSALMAETEERENKNGETCLHELKLSERKTLEEVFMGNCVKDVSYFAAKQAPGRVAYPSVNISRIFHYRYDIMKRGPCLDRKIKAHMEGGNEGAEREGVPPSSPTIDKAYDPR